jgi:hypothetical protein
MCARPRADGPHALASTSSGGAPVPVLANPTRSPLRTAVSVAAAPSSTRLTSARALPSPGARPAGRTLLPSIRSRATPGFEPAAARLRRCRRGQRGTLDAPRSTRAGSAPRRLASIVFAVLGVEENIPQASTVLDVTELTVTASIVLYLQGIDPRRSSPPCANATRRWCPQAPASGSDRSRRPRRTGASRRSHSAPAKQAHRFRSPRQSWLVNGASGVGHTRNAMGKRGCQQ